MINISNINAGDEISWFLSPSKESLITGVVIERVRAKARPKFQGVLTEGKPTRRSVSYIVKAGNKPLWIDASQVDGHDKLTSAVVEKTNTQPRADTVKPPMPDVFKLDFSSLAKYLPKDNPSFRGASVAGR